MTVRFFHATRLDDRLLKRWQVHIDRVPWSHYLADPHWAEIERAGSGSRSREPIFFWAEDDDGVCLSAIGVRHQLPVPGRAFWEFQKSPTFVDPAVFDEWLAWLVPTLGRHVARLRISPPAPLDGLGGDVETKLERHGFVRRRDLGTWATLTVDLTRDETEILASFRRQTRQAINKCNRLGITVVPKDTPEGWSVLCNLQTAMCVRVPALSISETALERISRFWLKGGTGGTVLLAERDEKRLAAALVVIYRGTAFLRLLPSARRDDGTPVSHLLVWEAMRWAKNRGCATFDLEGYSLVARPGEPLWGVNQFKRGFAPQEQPSRCVAIHEMVSAPLLVGAAKAARRTQSAARRLTSGQRT